MGYIDPPDHVHRNECCTPDAVYGTTINDRFLKLTVHFPANMPALSRKAEDMALVAELHKAILPVIERIYRDSWHALARKKLPGHTKPFPGRWEDLDPRRFDKEPRCSALEGEEVAPEPGSVQAVVAAATRKAEKDNWYLRETLARRAAQPTDARRSALEAVAEAAAAMPRETPAPGGAGTVHTFEIEAGVVWTLDKALRALTDPT